MRGLFLPGAKCTNAIWERLLPLLPPAIHAQLVSYPPEVTRGAQSVMDVAAWVFSQYGAERFDFLLGHSMGGFIALRLVADCGMRVPRVLLVESNPVPAGPFYRNLMTQENMALYGEKVMRMLQAEAAAYSPALLASLLDGFDESGAISRYTGTVRGIYGDRGLPNAPERIEALGLRPDILARLRPAFVENACHLPMIENPAGLSRAICRALEAPDGNI